MDDNLTKNSDSSKIAEPLNAQAGLPGSAGPETVRAYYIGRAADRAAPAQSRILMYVAIALAGLTIAAMLLLPMSQAYPSGKALLAVPIALFILLAFIVSGGKVEWILLLMIFNTMLGSAKLSEGSVLNLNRLMGLVIALIVMVDACILKRREFRFSIQGAWAIIFAATLVASIVFSVNAAVSLASLRQYFRLFLLYFLITNVITTRAWLYRLIYVLMGAAIALLVFSIIDNWSFRTYGLPIAYKLGLAGANAEGVEALFYGRDPNRLYGAFGSTADVNFFALILATSLPILFSFIGSKKKAAAAFSGLSSLAAIVGILLSLSRGALLGFLAATIAAAKKSLINRKIIFGLIAVAIICAPMVSSKSAKRIYSVLLVPFGAVPDNPTDLENVTNRIDYIKGALKMFLDYPLTGVGIGNFPYIYPKYAPVGATIEKKASHNTYLLLLTETGLFGLIAFGWGIILNFRTTQAVRRVAEQKNEMEIYRISSLIDVSLIAFLVSGFFIEAVHVDILWILIACTTCLRFIVFQGEGEGDGIRSFNSASLARNANKV